MKFHHGLALLIIAGAPIVVAVCLTIETFYRQRPLRNLIAIIPWAMVATLFLIVPVVSHCSDSWDVALAAPTILTPQELGSLRRIGLICPTSYRFQRDGRETCLMYDGDGGASVGCD